MGFIACFEMGEAKRGGGGSRGGGSRGGSRGGWGGSSSRGSSSRGSSYGGSSSYKKSKKSKAISTLKKVAVVGAVAYGAYQIGKMTSRFSNYGYGFNSGYDFNTWNRKKSEILDGPSTPTGSVEMKNLLESAVATT